MAVSWWVVAITTDRPRSSLALPPSTVPAARSLQARLASAPKTERAVKSATALRPSLSDALLFRSMFIEADKVTEGYRKASIFRSTERVQSQRALEPSHDDSKAERVEPRIQQFQAVCQRHQSPALLSGHLPELRHDLRSNFHIYCVYLPAASNRRFLHYATLRSG